MSYTPEGAYRLTNVSYSHSYYLAVGLMSTLIIVSHRETIRSGSTSMHEVQNLLPISSLYCSQITKAMQSRSQGEIDPASKSRICADHGHTPGSAQENDVGALQNVHRGQCVSFLFQS